MKQTTIKQLKAGEFFTKKPAEYPTEKQVWIRGAYDRENKKYECSRFDDVNAVCYISASKVVYTDFIF